MAIIGISGRAGSGKDTVGLMMRSLIEYPTLTYEEYKTHVVKEYDWEIKKFAGKLKEMITLILGCSLSDLENETFKNTELGEEWWYFGFGGKNKSTGLRTTVMLPYLETPLDTRDDPKQLEYLIKLTPRLLLQLLGTEGGRKVIHPNIWVNSLFSGYKPHNELISVDSIALRGVDGTTLPNWIITDTRFPNEAKEIERRGGIIIRLERNTKTSAGNLHESEIALDNYNFNYGIKNNNISLSELYSRVRELLIKIHYNEVH